MLHTQHVALDPSVERLVRKAVTDNHIRILHLPLSSPDCRSEFVPGQISYFYAASPKVILSANKAQMPTEI